MPTAVITPSTIAKAVPREEEPEAPYNWAKQARRESVEYKRLVRIKEINARRRSGKPRRAPK